MSSTISSGAGLLEVWHFLFSFLAVFLAWASSFFLAASAACLAAARMTSIYTNLSQATIKGFGVFFSPMPYTFIPASRSRVARRVKSLSLLTSTKPSQVPE